MTDKIKDNEQIYDDEIAPALKAISDKCMEREMPFVAVVEWSEGNIGRTLCQVPGQDLAMTMINHMGKTGTNIDGFVIGLLRYCKENNIDYSSSIVLMRMDGKL